jgi:hypothetical protein
MLSLLKLPLIYYSSVYHIFQVLYIYYRKELPFFGETGIISMRILPIFRPLSAPPAPHAQSTAFSTQKQPKGGKKPVFRLS